MGDYSVTFGFKVGDSIQHKFSKHKGRVVGHMSDREGLKWVDFEYVNKDGNCNSFWERETAFALVRRKNKKVS